MHPLTPVDSMMEAMAYIAKDKASSRNYMQAIKEITSYIDSIEAGNEKVHKTYGKNLVPLYCARAKAHYEKGAKTNDLSELELARRDVGRAVEVTRAFYPYMQPNDLAQMQQGIYNTISPDDHQRQEALNVIFHMTGEASFTPAQRVVPLTQPPPSFLTHVYSMLLGVGVWAVAVGIAYFGSSPGLVVAGLIAIFLLYLSCFWGWSWLTDTYARGAWIFIAKAAVFLVILCTVVGLIPIIYWTGKGAMLWYQHTFH